MIIYLILSFYNLYRLSIINESVPRYTNFPKQHWRCLFEKVYIPVNRLVLFYSIAIENLSLRHE